MFALDGSTLLQLDPASFDEGKRVLVDIAEVLGVPLQAMPASVDPGVTLAYLPDDMAWPEIHISLMLVNWRIQACDAPLSYCAHWCSPGIGIDTFTTALHHLRAWGGDPTDEPTGWTKRFGSLGVAFNWERQPGLRLDQLGWDAFRPTRPKGL